MIVVVSKKHSKKMNHQIYSGQGNQKISSMSTENIATDVESINENMNKVIYDTSQEEDDTLNEYYIEDEKSLSNVLYILCSFIFILFLHIFLLYFFNDYLHFLTFLYR